MTILQLVSSLNPCCNIIDRNFAGGVDYGSRPYTVKFPAGVTMVAFDVPITDDMILEGNKDFDLIVVPGSLPGNMTRGNPSRVTVTIVDNDGQCLCMCRQ